MNTSRSGRLMSIRPRRLAFAELPYTTFDHGPYAADPEQPEIVRRDAILRLGTYGQPEDLVLLRELVDSGVLSL